MDLEQRDKRIQDQTQTILKLNKQLVEKSNYISDYVVGKGFPIVVTNSIKSLNPRNDEMTTFTIRNDNDLPLYDVTAVIFDWNYIRSKILSSNHLADPAQLLRQEDLTKSMIYRFDQSQIFAHSRVTSREKFDLRDGLIYIILKSRSSFVYEKMAFVAVSNVIYQGFVVYEHNGNILKEWISPGAPESVRIAIKKKFDLIPNSVSFTLTN